MGFKIISTPDDADSEAAVGQEPAPKKQFTILSTPPSTSFEDDTTARRVGQNFAEAGKGIPAGAAGLVGTAVKGVAGLTRTRAGFRPYIQELAKVADYSPEQVNELRARARDDENLSKPEREDFYRAIGGIEAGEPAKDWIDLLQTAPVQESGAYRAGEAIAEKGDIFPAREGYEDSPGRMLGEGVGSLAAGVGLSVVPGGQVAAPAAFMLSGAGEAVENAVQKGATEDQIIEAARLGNIPGLTDSVPIEVLLGRIPLPGGKLITIPTTMLGSALKVAGKIGVQGVIEGIQEGGQQFLQNMISKHVHSPDQDLGEGVVPNVGVGGSVGMLAEGAKLLVEGAAHRRGRRARGEANTEAPAEVDPEAIEPAQQAPVAEQPAAHQAPTAEQAAPTPLEAPATSEAAAPAPVPLAPPAKPLGPVAGALAYGKQKAEERAAAASAVRQPTFMDAFAEDAQPASAVEDTSTAQPDLPTATGERADPVRLDPETPADLTPARTRVAEPTEAQAEAGNYRKGHVKVHGLDITIENPVGSERKGVDPTGEPWSVKMPADYGYIKRTVGADNEQVDVYLGHEPQTAQDAYIVDQVDAETGKFDEHKLIIGAANEDEARALYEMGFSDGKGGDRMGAISRVPMPELKSWLTNGAVKKPFGQITKSEPTSSIGAKDDTSSAALKWYQATGSAQVNRFLREGALPKVQGADPKKTADAIEALKDAAKPISTDMVVYRGMRVQDIGRDGGFMSVSTNPSIAHDHARKADGVVVKMTLPKGTPVTSLEGGEGELVLMPGATIAKVSQAEKDMPSGSGNHSVIVVDATLGTAQSAPEQSNTRAEIEREAEAMRLDLIPSEIEEVETLMSEGVSLNDALVHMGERAADIYEAELAADARAEGLGDEWEIPFFDSEPTVETQPQAESARGEAATFERDETSRSETASEQSGKDQEPDAEPDEVAAPIPDEPLAERVIKTPTGEVRISAKWGVRPKAVGKEGFVSFELHGPVSETGFKSVAGIRLEDTSEDFLADVAEGLVLGNARAYADTVAKKPRKEKPTKDKPVKTTPAQPKATAPAVSEYGSKNTLVTADRAAELRERLKAKLKNQVSAGIDPEIMAIGAELTAFHIEAGARKFTDLAKVLAEDLGTTTAALRKYLRSWYNGARDLMEDAGIDIAGMDDADAVRAALSAMDEETTDGLQNTVPDSDEGASPRDVSGTDEGGPDTGSRAGQERGSPQDARTPDTAESDDGAGKRSRTSRVRRNDRVSDARRANDDVTGENYQIAVGALDEERGWKQKARDNIRAIEIVRQIEAEGRHATRGEQEQISRYVGWGGIKNAFPDASGAYGKGFEDIGAKLKELLTPTEYQTAERSIQYAHFTSETIVRAMWAAAERFGFEGGTVFEPGMGTGNFAGMMPADLAAKTAYSGLEMDHITARIARALYPRWGVRREDFTQSPLPRDTFDLVIGNPPFADITISSDPAYAKHKFLLHDYFFAKSLDAVRPGGLLMFVTSAGTMNKIDPAARTYFADRADLVGAVRLPGDAFKKNAGTQVTTDIIVLRKKLDAGQVGKSDNLVPRDSWLDVGTIRAPDPDGQFTSGNSNTYFIEHPDMVLGEEGFFDKLYKGRYAVRARDGFDLDTELAAAFAKMPEGVVAPWLDTTDRANIDFGTKEVKEGSYYIGPKGDLMQMVGGVGAPVAKRGKGVTGGKTAAEISLITQLIPIRDALRDVYASDLAEDKANAAKARKRLNESYDAFVKANGPINKGTFQTRRPTDIQAENARSKAREEARYVGEEFDEGSFDPSDMIAAKKTLGEIAAARNAMRERLGSTFDEGTFVPDEMPDVLIEKRPNIAPMADDPENYRLRAIEKYNDATGEGTKTGVFSHNVITKEKEPEINSVNDALFFVLNKTGRVDIPAIAAAAGKTENQVIEELGDGLYRLPGTDAGWVLSDEYLSGNVRKKLIEAQAAAERDPRLRRNVSALEAVIPPALSSSDIKASLGMPWIPPADIEAFGRDALGLSRLTVKSIPKLGLWIVDGDEASAASTSNWGTARMNAVELISAALNHNGAVVKDRDPDGKSSTKNVVETEAAEAKLTEIKERFNKWVWEDEARTDRLVAHYNENYNATVTREWNGDYLTTPGIAADWSWRPHQTRVIARIIQAGNTYLAHAVGAGKTSEMIGAGMEMRRLGLVRKPMYAVPNHMLGQFTKEFYEQYPTARIRVADERAFHTDRRKQFIADVAVSDLDAVIITHSAFGLIPVSPEFQDSLVQVELDNYRDLLEQEKGDRITRSRLQKQIERLENRLAGNAKKQDSVFTFEEMGIDFLFVDEAHEFRKLDFATKMSNVKGVSPDGSKMSWDLFAKTRYLETKNPGRNLVLASGTPVTNTMAELFTLSRYMQPNELDERNLTHFDAWASAFGDTVTALEQDASGGYVDVTRFAEFANVPELSTMVRQVMDVVTSNELGQYVARPKLAGGKRKMHIAERSNYLEAFQNLLAKRMVAIRAKKGKPKKGDDIMLSVINDGRHAAIDMRLVDPRLVSKTPSKLDELVDEVFAIWERTKKQPFYRPVGIGYAEHPFEHGPATQMIFANLGVGTARAFNVNKYIIAQLTSRGVPRAEIENIAEHKTAVARQKLFNDMNEGKVRVLIGSTKRMATGVNAQRRLKAIHNLDPLWFPAEDEQRNGRGIRQGNTNNEIEIHDYSTKGTYDSTMWGLMETKARFIEGFFRGDPTLRHMEDLGEASMYEQAKALSTNDPRLLELTEKKQKLAKLVRSKLSWQSRRDNARSRIREAQKKIEYVDEILPAIEADIDQLVSTKGDEFKGTIEGKEYTKRAEFGDALARAFEKLKSTGKPTKAGLLGKLGGFEIFGHTFKASADDMFMSGGMFIKRNGGREAEVDQSTSDVGQTRIVENVLSGFNSDLSYYEGVKTAALRDIHSFGEITKDEFSGQPAIDELETEVNDLESEIKATSKASGPAKQGDLLPDGTEDFAWTYPYIDGQQTGLIDDEKGRKPEEWLKLGRQQKAREEEAQQKLENTPEAKAKREAAALVDRYFAESQAARAEVVETSVDDDDTSDGAGISFNRRDIARTNTNTQAFKRWFANSKVVDSEGQPLTVYHGTSADFDAFAPTENRSRQSFGNAYFFSDARNTPNMIAAGNTGGRVIEAYLSLQNPKYLDGEFWGDPRQEPIQIKTAKDEGYDGLVGQKIEGGDTFYVAFSPSQIKSIHNRGDFTDDQRIMYSRRNIGDGTSRINDTFALGVFSPTGNLRRGGPEIVRRLKGEASRRQKAVANGKDATTIDRADIKDVEEFIDWIGAEMFGDIGISISRRTGPLGMFNAANRMVAVFQSAVERGDVSSTSIHELWHSLERFLSPKDLLDMKTTYRRAAKKYLAARPYLKPFTSSHQNGKTVNLDRRSITDKAQARAYMERYPTPPDEAIVYDRKKETVRLRNTDENYRFFNEREFFAETMLDQYWAKKDQLSGDEPNTVLGRVARAAARAFARLVNAIASLMGRRTAERILGNFIEGRYDFNQRNRLDDDDGIFDMARDDVETLEDYIPRLTASLDSFARKLVADYLNLMGADARAALAERLASAVDDAAKLQAVADALGVSIIGRSTASNLSKAIKDSMRRLTQKVAEFSNARDAVRDAEEADFLENLISTPREPGRKPKGKRVSNTEVSAVDKILKRAPKLPDPADYNAVHRAFLHPYQIATNDAEFADVFHWAMEFNRLRNESQVLLAAVIEPYMNLSEAARENVNKVLEIGRLEGADYSDRAKISVVNDLHKHALLPVGQRITLTAAERNGYLGARAMFDRAMLMFKQQVLVEVGLGNVGDPRTAEGIKAYAEAEDAELTRNEYDALLRAADMVDAIEKARRVGYIPFSRYGDYSITVTNNEGQVVWYQKVEKVKAGAKPLSDELTARAAAKLRADLIARYPRKEGFTVQKTRFNPKVDVTGLGDIDFAVLDEMAKRGGADAETVDAYHEAIRAEWTKQGFRAHFIESKNTPGYEQDFTRSISDYIVGISGYLARRNAMGPLDQAIGRINPQKTGLRQYAKSYKNYIFNPVEEFGQWRQLMFYAYLAGNVSSAALNLTQVPIFTLPVLTMVTNPVRAVASLTNAMRITAKMFRPQKRAEFLNFDINAAPADLREDLLALMAEGTLVPMVTLENMGVAAGRKKFLRGLGEKQRQIMEIAGTLFTVAERANRLATAIAALRLAKDPKVLAAAHKAFKGSNVWLDMVVDGKPTPRDVARYVIHETHFLQGKMNRPSALRGMWAVVGQFKSFTMNALQLQYRMATSYGPDGKKALALNLFLLFMASGMFGLPGADDAKNLLEWLYKFGSKADLDVEKEMQELAVEMFGEDTGSNIGEAIRRGVLRQSGADLSQRVGMGEIMPLSLPSPNYSTSAATEKQLENLGLPGAVAGTGLRAADQLLSGDVTSAAATLSRFVISAGGQNAAQAVAMKVDGLRSRRGAMVMNADELTASDVALRAFGFQSTRIARRREQDWMQTRAESAVSELQSNFKSRLVRAEAAEDYAESDRIYAEIDAWNEDKPDYMQVEVSQDSIRRGLEQELEGKSAVRDKRAPVKARNERDRIEQIMPEN